MHPRCRKCVFLVFRQCAKYPDGGYVCFSGFSPCSRCYDMCLMNLKALRMSLDDLHKPLQLYFWSFF